MARKKVKHRDGSVEEWDSDSGTYVHKDSDGVVVESRDLTSEECKTLDPTSVQMRALNTVLDQLILDMLMGGMF